MAVLREVIDLVRQPGTDTGWSSYESADALASELEEHLCRLAAGSTVDAESLRMLRILFAPTGPLQETSISSGWGRRFLELAARFDRATARP